MPLNKKDQSHIQYVPCITNLCLTFSTALTSRPRSPLPSVLPPLFFRTMAQIATEFTTSRFQGKEGDVSFNEV